MTDSAGASSVAVATDFEVEREIHHGRQSRVFRARLRATGELVAMKLAASDAEREVARIQQEAALLGELQHPNIVRLVAAGGWGSSAVYLATEWVGGDTLASRLELGAFTIAESVFVARELAEALGAAHRAGIVHRDVKPTNVMLTAKNELKLVDFGIARRTGAPGLTAHVDFEGGTWAYMSPEQAMGVAELGPRADLFSLGCVLFECLCGVPAFPGERSAALVAKIWSEPPALSTFCTGVPGDLAALVAQLLSQDPARRPKNGAAAAAALTALGPLPERRAERRI